MPRPGQKDEISAAGIPGTPRALPGEGKAVTGERQTALWLPGFQPPPAAQTDKYPCPLTPPKLCDGHRALPLVVSSPAESVPVPCGHPSLAGAVSRRQDSIRGAQEGGKGEQC